MSVSCNFSLRIIANNAYTYINICLQMGPASEVDRNMIQALECMDQLEMCGQELKSAGQPYDMIFKG